MDRAHALNNLLVIIVNFVPVVPLYTPPPNKIKVFIRNLGYSPFCDNAT